MALETKTEQVAAALERDLMRGDYRGPLPAERELAERFGVCRTTVREAVARLTAKELVTVRPRTGIRSRAPRTWTFDRMPELIEAHRTEPLGASHLEDYLEARRLLLGEVVALACMRRSDDDVQTIKFLVWDLEQTVSRRAGYAVERCERDVLEAFVWATGNVVLAALFNSLAKLNDLLPDKLPSPIPSGPSMPVEVYRLLADYLERRGAEPAKQLVLEALLQAHREMKLRFVAGPGLANDVQRYGP
jgi:DNA-binding FadR family transcriptional regulator